MLFRKKIDRFCSYCVYAGKLDDETYLCAKRGFVAACHHCRKFEYDPLKRVPKRRKPKDFSEYDELDFSHARDSRNCYTGPLGNVANGHGLISALLAAHGASLPERPEIIMCS